MVTKMHEQLKRKMGHYEICDVASVDPFSYAIGYEYNEIGRVVERSIGNASVVTSYDALGEGHRHHEFAGEFWLRIFGRDAAGVVH